MKGRMYMNFDSENAFDPLINFVEKEDYDFEETMGSFMYMYDENDVYFYKDIDSRQYLKLDKSGARVGGKWNGSES